MTAVTTAVAHHRQTVDVATTQPARRSFPRYRALAGRVLRGVLLALAVAMLVRFVRDGWPEIRASLSQVTIDQLPLVGLAAVVEMAWMYAMSQVYRSALMGFGGRVGRRAAVRISMAAFTLSRILPGGGAAGGAVAVRELIALGNPPLRTIVSQLASWWITMTGLASLLVAGIGLSVVNGTLPERYLVGPGIALAVLVAGGAGLTVAARSPRFQARMSRTIARGAARLGAGTTADGASVAAATRGVRITGLLAVFGWGMVVWITDAAALWLALAAFGWHVDVGVLLVAYGVANLISALPELTPGWLGVLEASVAVTLAAFGVPQGIAALAVLVYRLVSYWLPTAAGIPAAASVLGRRPLGRDRHEVQA
jgi:uncharacterized membrane protein YbhN (UPF0104 family)